MCEMDLLIKRYIKVPGQFKILHCWADQPLLPSWLIEKAGIKSPFAGTGFLRHPHRHTFQVWVTVEVSHSDRAVEFYDLQAVLDDFLASAYPSNTPKVMPGSCEMFAESIMRYLTTLGLKCVKVEVGEDGETWGIVELVRA
jgi:hypothetical protein